MSFITKRERVFNEYDLFDLPARNEGKLKAYASCTDARAWSHFCSDKSEHLVEIIKRNNETVRPKYLPTNVIVDTLMVAKNAEIARLKQKIEEFEQMLAAYDQLDLSCDQKCEIANAHAAIKAANKELDELCLDLDLSGYTEGIDSEDFATGKSRGDEATPKTIEQLVQESSPRTQTQMQTRLLTQMQSQKDTKGVQSEMSCTCEVATFVKDPRIDEMQDTIIAKDAKLNAMKNTIAVMENDVCEPYCIYAHIYTALEKIFGILCQNDKYRHYLKLMTAGKDTRCIDIKGKILFKLKVLEKFCCALIAPCSHDFVSNSPPPHHDDCACYRVDVLSRVEPTYALTSAETKQPSLDNKRAQLVADIIQNEEMKEILRKESSTVKPDEDLNDDTFVVDNYNIDTENLKRLKSLQENYDDLMTCYETLKHDKDNLEKRCNKYEEIEKEFESLKEQMREYNSLWNEKEHYRKRSADLDTLKEQYLILTDETSSLETQLKAESEINNIKCKAMDGLRSENIMLEKKLNDASIAFEKEKNALLCKLQEADCRVMCQEQQIKSLSLQIDKLLERDEKTHSRDVEHHSLTLLDEIQSSKEQIKNLRDALFCSEEEKQDIQKHYQDQLELINELKLEIEDWKSTYEKTLQRNDYLEKYTESLIEETRLLSQDVDEKTTAVENLINVIDNKSQEINKLMIDIENKKHENKDLISQLNEIRARFDSSVVSLENEKYQALQSLQLARQESQDLLEKVKDYDQIVHKKADVTKSLELQLEDNKELQVLLDATMDENRNLKIDLANLENNNRILLHELERLREVNEYVVESITNLQDEKKEYKISLDLTRKQSGELKDKLLHFENMALELKNLQDSHEKLFNEKLRLERELLAKSSELDRTIHCLQLTKTESDDLIDRLQQSEGSKESELARISQAYQKLSDEKLEAQRDLMEKNKNIDNLLNTLNNLKLENEELLRKCSQGGTLEQELADLKKAYADLTYERNMLQNDFDDKTVEINNLCNTLENKIEENRELYEQLKSLEMNQASASHNIQILEDEKRSTEAKLNVLQTESVILVDRIKHYEALETEFDQLKRAHDQMKLEKEKLQTELQLQLADLKRKEQENSELQSHSQILLSQSEVLENALIGARTELTKKSNTPANSYQDILMEIKIMREEKLNNQKKIRDLLDKLEESENIISNLSEDVMARDDKIATLQNYINELEEEVRRLHGSLDEVIDSGEQMKDISFQKIDSLKNMEAHHSRATHNMKMELAKLQHENSMLSDQLSMTKVKSEETSRDIKHKYVSQIKQLQNEREIIVTDIKQLELKAVGDSALAPNNCDVEEILLSLDRIRKSLDVRTSRSSSLEQTLYKVQTSSQLLLSKADEAKKLVEREKQKIISEKEDAIIDKQNMEKQLLDFKEKLENQIANDKVIIKDLEATILNQKLIIDKINQSTQDYISKLKDELQTLQGLYQNSVEKISELQERLQNVTEDKNKLQETIEMIKADFENKCKEVADLQKQLDDIKNIPSQNIGTQAQVNDIYRNMGSQTEKESFLTQLEKTYKTEASTDTKDNIIDYIDSINMMEMNKPPLDKKHTELQMKGNPHVLNEVQILAASIEPAIEAVKSRYVDYKMKRLSPGRLEQHSIACFTDDENKPTTSDRTHKKSRKSGKKYANAKTQSTNLIDIYNRQSMHTNSSKGIDESENVISGKMPSQGKSTGYTTRDSYDTDSNIVSKYKDSKTYGGSTSDKSTDKDLFVIYKDSESSYNNITSKRQTKGTWSGKGHSEIVVEAVTVHPTNKGKIIEMNRPTSHVENVSFTYQENDENLEDDSVKQKLKISLPRVGTESPSIVTTSDGDKKSLDSYTLGIYSSPKRLSDSDTKITDGADGKTVKHGTPSLPTLSNEDNHYLGSYNSLAVGSDEDTVRPGIMKTKAIETDSGTSKQKHSQFSRKKATISTPYDSESHHKLSRVGADVLLLAEQDQIIPRTGRSSGKRQNFALEYIMDTVQGEVDPEAIKYYTAKDLRKSRSDERFNLVKIGEKTDSSPSRLSEFKMSSNEYKTNSTNSKSSGKSNQKSYTERSIMAKLDINDEYENKISSLTRALENIEKDYKKKIEAIKMQYDSNIKSIINEHNQGVKSIQGLHEETLQDIIKLHENEVENLRTMSIEAMRKADKLEKENRALKTRTQDCNSVTFDEIPIKIASPETKRRRKCRGETKMLTKTTVEAFNVKPKTRSNGPCTCSLDVNISDTIRNIFEQVDVEQRKMAEHTYMKYIANKILNGNVDGPFKIDGLQALDAQELSFLHLKVCRTWKSKLSKEEALQKRIDSLENELMSKQRNAQQHIAELDRKVAEERRRLQEVREAVCRSTPTGSRGCSPDLGVNFTYPPPMPPLAVAATAGAAEKDACGCNTQTCNVEVGGRRSAGDLGPEISTLGLRTTRRTRVESNRAVLARLDVEERRERRLYNDEPPTRLRRTHERQPLRFAKK